MGWKRALCVAMGFRIVGGGPEGWTGDEQSRVALRGLSGRRLFYQRLINAVVSLD